MSAVIFECYPMNMNILAVEKEVFEGFLALGRSEEFQEFRCFDGREKTLGDERLSVSIRPFRAPFLPFQPQVVIQWMFGI